MRAKKKIGLNSKLRRKLLSFDLTEVFDINYDDYDEAVKELREIGERYKSICDEIRFKTIELRTLKLKAMKTVFTLALIHDVPLSRIIKDANLPKRWSNVESMRLNLYTRHRQYRGTVGSAYGVLLALEKYGKELLYKLASAMAVASYSGTVPSLDEAIEIFKEVHEKWQEGMKADIFRTRNTKSG